MKKFKTDFTAARNKILCVIGPDSLGYFAGVVERGDELFGVTWNKDGANIQDYDDEDFNLVPLAPKALTAYAVLGKNNGLALFLDKATAEDVAERENGQVIEMRGEYYV